ncbi:unnamed protein product, partial [Amoebophrya sp. A25]
SSSNGNSFLFGHKPFGLGPDSAGAPGDQENPHGSEGPSPRSAIAAMAACPSRVGRRLGFLGGGEQVELLRSDPVHIGQRFEIQFLTEPLEIHFAVRHELEDDRNPTLATANFQASSKGSHEV